MAVNNSTILGSLYLKGTNDYQQLMPNPTQYTVAEQAKYIFAPQNTRLYNMFVDALVNRIGKTFISQNKEWENPLAVFEKGDLPFGFTAEEIALKFIKAHSYDDANETLLKLHRPEARVCFHSVDFQQYYPVTINRAELEMAFMSEDSGLQDFISGIFTNQLNSCHYDLYNTTVQLIAEAHNNWGLRKVNVSAVTDKSTAQALLMQCRALAGKMAFPSCLYNAGVVEDIPVFSRKSELVLLTTPEVNAQLDVYALADLFNIDKAEVPFRVVEVREFPIANVQAVLCDESFFQIYNKIWDTTNFYNPETLGTTYYLHCWKVISASPFANCILLTTEAATVDPVVEMNISSIDLACDATSNTIAAGETAQLSVTLAGSVTDNTAGVKLAPESVTFTIESEDAPLNSRTYVDDKMVLHTQKSLETGDELTITAKSTYINPSGATQVLVDTLTISIDNAHQAGLTAFSLPVGTGGAAVAGVIDDVAGTITVEAVSGTTVTSLAATFTKSTSGAKVYVGSTEQTSGTTTNDFSDPVTYTVKVGTDVQVVKNYIVTVNVAE